MNDQLIAEIKQLQNIVTTLISTTKDMDQSLERLRSIEQLLERVAGSNERVEQMMDKAWSSYDKMAK